MTPSTPAGTPEDYRDQLNALAAEAAEVIILQTPELKADPSCRYRTRLDDLAAPGTDPQARRDFVRELETVLAALLPELAVVPSPAVRADWVLERDEIRRRCALVLAIREAEYSLSAARELDSALGVSVPANPDA